MLHIKEGTVHPDYLKYPSSDGEPMAETTRHFRWIVTIKENLEITTKNNDTFVAGDLLWYPVRGKANICKAPDVMVAIGRPKGERLSYLQWHEDNIAPQVVFEIFSKSNRRRLHKEGLEDFYLEHGVQEYYTYDPDHNDFTVRTHAGDHFDLVSNVPNWASPLLGITFQWSEAGLSIFHPNGDPFVDLVELESKNKELMYQVKEEQRLRREERKLLLKEGFEAREAAEADRLQALIAKQKAEAAELKTKTERARADAAELEAMAEKNRAKAERRRAETAELETLAEKQRAEAEKQRAETAELKALAERQRAEAAEEQARAEKQKAAEAMNLFRKMEKELKKMGIDPNAIN